MRSHNNSTDHLLTLSRFLCCPTTPDLTEHLHQLDYPHRFTISTLASAHGSAAQFRHVAACLQWLAGRLEPGAQLAGAVHTEAERIVLVRSAAEFFVTRAGLRLNPRRLYASSSATASELLKVTQLLIRAPQLAASGADAGGAAADDDARHAERSGSGTFAGAAVDLGDKIDELRRGRELSGELTQIGARLYDLLASELHNKERRTVQATRPLELAAVERSLKASVAALLQRVQQQRHQLEASRTERTALQAKVDRKAGELERLRQRLGALQKIRPAYLEEFERLEVDLQALFVQYALRVRCLDALRAQVASRLKSGNANRQPSEWPIVKPAGAGAMAFLPEGLIDSDDEVAGGIDATDYDDEDDMRAVNELMARGQNRRRDVAMAEAANMIRESKTATRLRVRTAANRGGAGAAVGGGRFVGSMTGEGGGASDLEDNSSLVSDDNGSYSDLDLIGGLRSDEDGEEDDDDDELMLMRTEPTVSSAMAAAEAEAKGAAGKTKGVGMVQSDEDF